MSEIVLECDTVIIGAGTAGIEAYKAATEAGANCILVESGPLGTSSRRTGDTPVSFLMEAGKKCHALMELDTYGISPKSKVDISLNTDHVLNNLRAARSKETGDVLSFIYRIPETNRLIGKARFVDEHTIMVNENFQVRFKSAVISTGSAPVIPFELSRYGADSGVYTTNDFFDMDHLPNSIAVFGSNREGLQIGQALSYLGVKTVVFGSNRIWDLTDESVMHTTIDEFNDRFDLVLNTYTTAIEKTSRGFSIYYLDHTNYENHLSVETILSASIRCPKLEGLNIRSLGIKVDRFGCIDIKQNTLQTSVDHIFAAGEVTDLNMTVDFARYQGKLAGFNAANFGCIDIKQNTLQTSVDHIFAAGEVTDLNMTVDFARYQGKLAGFNAANYPNMSTAKKPIKVNIMNTDPEVAMVGMSYEEVVARAKTGRHFIAGEVRASEGMYRITKNDGGIMRIYCDEETKQILGAEMCLHNAGHIAHELAIAMAGNLTIDEISRLPLFKPSYEEIIRSACQSVSRNFIRKNAGS